MANGEKAAKVGKVIGAVLNGLAHKLPIIGDAMTVISDKDHGSPQGEMNWPKFMTMVLRYAVLGVIAYYVFKGEISIDDADAIKDIITN